MIIEKQKSMPTTTFIADLHLSEQRRILPRRFTFHHNKAVDTDALSIFWAIYSGLDW
jgi:hypothetical protein